MRIVITADRLEELLQAAYDDGHEDGCRAICEGHGIDFNNIMRNDATGKTTCSDGWPNSVTADQFDALKERVRNGKQP